MTLRKLKSYNNKFFNSRESGMSFEDVVEKILNFIKEDPQSVYRLAIGSDSQVKEGKTIFVTAIIIHRVGKVAWGCVRKYEVPRRVTNLREKIAIETTLTQELAYRLQPNILQEILDVIIPHIDKGADFYHEIHIDVGHKGASRKLIKEMLAYFSGLGFETKIKPDSYAASSFANKYTK